MKIFRKFAIWLYHITGIYVISLEGAGELSKKNFKRASEILEEREKIWPNDPLLLELQTICYNEQLDRKEIAMKHETDVFNQGMESHRNGIHGNA